MWNGFVYEENLSGERKCFLLQISNMVLLEYLARCSIDEHLLHEELRTDKGHNWLRSYLITQN